MRSEWPEKERERERAAKGTFNAFRQLNHLSFLFSACSFLRANCRLKVDQSGSKTARVKLMWLCVLWLLKLCETAMIFTTHIYMQVCSISNFNFSDCTDCIYLLTLLAYLLTYCLLMLLMWLMWPYLLWVDKGHSRLECKSKKRLKGWFMPRDEWLHQWTGWAVSLEKWKYKQKVKSEKWPVR